METTTKTETNPITTQNQSIAVNIPVKSRRDKNVRVNPDTQTKIKRLRAKGESYDKIVRLTGVSKPTLLKICHDPINQEQINAIKIRLAERSAQIAQQSLDSIKIEDINNASLVQKATVYGIMADKFVDLTASNGDNTGDSSILTGLKKDDLMNYLKDGNSINIGIVIKPPTNTTPSGSVTK